MTPTVTYHPETVASRTSLVRSGPAGPLVLHPRRRRDAVLARLRSSSLDARLAAGAAPESDRLLAARAAQLVGPRYRRSLAAGWDRVVARAAQPSRPADPRVPIARGAVRAAADEISALTAALRDAAPVAARDVARTRILLTGAGGPVYRGGAGLRTSVARLVADLTFAEL